MSTIYSGYTSAPEQLVTFRTPPSDERELLARVAEAEALWRESRRDAKRLRTAPDEDLPWRVPACLRDASEMVAFWRARMAELGLDVDALRLTRKVTQAEIRGCIVAFVNHAWWIHALGAIEAAGINATESGRSVLRDMWDAVLDACERQYEIEAVLARPGFLPGGSPQVAGAAAEVAGFASSGLRLYPRLARAIQAPVAQKEPQRTTLHRELLGEAVIAAAVRPEGETPREFVARMARGLPRPRGGMPAFAGQTRGSPDFTDEAIDMIDLGKLAATPALSTRERAVLECLMTGATTKETAATLHVTESTVRVHVHNLRKKLRRPTRTPAA